MAFDFEKALRRKIDQHTKLVERKNRRVKDGNGIFDRWENPVLTAAHTPLFWRYDLDPRRNPFLQERLGVNCVFNAGRHRVEREGVPGGPRRGPRPQELLRGGGERQRRRQLPLLGPPRRDARDRGPRHQRLRHAPHRARGRLGLRDLLHGAEGPAGRSGRHLLGGRPGRDRADEGPREVGAPARPQVAVGPAEERRPPPGAREGALRALHPAAGQLHRGGEGRRDRLRPVRDDGGARRSARRRSSTRRSTTR